MMNTKEIIASRVEIVAGWQRQLEDIDRQLAELDRIAQRAERMVKSMDEVMTVTKQHLDERGMREVGCTSAGGAYNVGEETTENNVCIGKEWVMTVK